MLKTVLLLAAVHTATAIGMNSTGDYTNDLIESTTEKQTARLCDIGCTCPGKGQMLMFMDCSRLGISRLPSFLVVDSTVTSLSFRSNHLESLRMKTFEKADEVEDLDFTLNAIKHIDNYTFAPFMSVTNLRLSHNHITKITLGMLNGLSNLRVLELGYNVIESVSPLSFIVTPNLQELRLQKNPLFNLPENVFQYLPHLEKLDLQDTGLVMLPDNIFKPTPRLHWLSLATNELRNVPEEALSHAPHLEILNLSDNDFTILVEGAFKRLSSITVLYLNNNDKLFRIEKDALAGLLKLKSLFCSYNSKLSYIDENVFGSVLVNASTMSTPPKENLYLRQNAIQTLKSPLELQSWSSMSFVDLAENPWRCDCNMVWMMQLTKETQVNIRCNSPRHLHGRTFDTIEPSALRCQGSWAIATFALVIGSVVAFGAVVLAVSAVVCSRTPVGLYVRAKQQFSYAKVQPKIETVDLEWDPSADM